MTAEAFQPNGLPNVLEIVDHFGAEIMKPEDWKVIGDMVVCCTGTISSESWLMCPKSAITVNG
jgi:hypothetical protein